MRQFHFTSWPDHGVPETTDLLINFRHLVHEYSSQNPIDSPTLVHCRWAQSLCVLDALLSCGWVLKKVLPCKPKQQQKTPQTKTDNNTPNNSSKIDIYKKTQNKPKKGKKKKSFKILLFKGYLLCPVKTFPLLCTFLPQKYSNTL